MTKKHTTQTKSADKQFSKKKIVQQKKIAKQANSSKLGQKRCKLLISPRASAIKQKQPDAKQQGVLASLKQKPKITPRLSELFRATEKKNDERVLFGESSNIEIVASQKNLSVIAQKHTTGGQKNKTQTQTLKQNNLVENWRETQKYFQAPKPAAKPIRASSSRQQLCGKNSGSKYPDLNKRTNISGTSSQFQSMQSNFTFNQQRTSVTPTTKKSRNYIFEKYENQKSKTKSDQGKYLCRNSARSAQKRVSFLDQFQLKEDNKNRIQPKDAKSISPKYRPITTVKFDVKQNSHETESRDQFKSRISQEERKSSLRQTLEQTHLIQDKSLGNKKNMRVSSPVASLDAPILQTHIGQKRVAAKQNDQMEVITPSKTQISPQNSPQKNKRKQKEEIKKANKAVKLPVFDQKRMDGLNKYLEINFKDEVQKSGDANLVDQFEKATKIYVNKLKNLHLFRPPKV